ncbi:hypothetical protein BOSE127_40270 [Bosea sp. 127]|nr:hypothetical protein BOSE127_40270 [Bosea sp. 127]
MPGGGDGPGWCHKAAGASERAAAAMLLFGHGCPSDLCRPTWGASARAVADRPRPWRRPYRRLLSGDSRWPARLGACLRRWPRGLRAGLAGPWPLADAAGLCHSVERRDRDQPAAPAGGDRPGSAAGTFSERTDGLVDRRAEPEGGRGDRRRRTRRAGQSPAGAARRRRSGGQAQGR